MNKDQERKIMDYWDLMRGTVRQGDYIAATVLVNEVKNRMAITAVQETPDTVYSALLEVADELHIMNPFIDKERFFFIYQEGKQLAHPHHQEAAPTFGSSDDGMRRYRQTCCLCCQPLCHPLAGCRTARSIGRTCRAEGLFGYTRLPAFRLLTLPKGDGRGNPQGGTHR